jgi:nitrogenase-stabilizing/protective protein
VKSQLWRDLADLSSAEDFFAYFDLTFDPRVMAVSRLHILKRFHDNLSCVDGLQSLDDSAARDVYRRQLADAYCEFAAGIAPTALVFPGLGRMGGGFVALSNVRRSKRAAPENKTSESVAP